MLRSTREIDCVTKSAAWVAYLTVLKAVLIRVEFLCCPNTGLKSTKPVGLSLQIVGEPLNYLSTTISAFNINTK